jgi:phage terminase large subunit
MLFMGLDNPDKIKSLPDITQIVVEEATEITFDDFSQVK